MSPYDKSAIKASFKDRNDHYVLKLPTVMCLDVCLDSISDEASTHCGDHTFGNYLQCSVDDAATFWYVQKCCNALQDACKH